MGNDFLRRVQETITIHQMIHRGDRLVVAVSGGPDSMALLAALHQLRSVYDHSLWAAHYNHGIRAEAGEKESEFVRCLALKMEIPFITEADDGSLKLPRGNLEESARNKRYRFLEKTAARVGAHRVALGHTASDQAETFFLRLFRGSGTRGLGSIPPVRGDLFIRPLIALKRSEVMEFLRSADLPWVEDSSNLKTSFMRNKIRLHLIPQLIKDFEPTIVEKIGSATQLLRGDEDFLEEVSLAEYRSLRRDKEREVVSVDVEGLARLPAALQRRVIRHAIREFNPFLRRISLNHLVAITELLKSGSPHAGFSLPDGMVVKRVYGCLVIGPANEKGSGFFYEFHSLPREIIIPEIGKKITVKVVEGNGMLVPPPDRKSALLDLERLEFPLVVRNWKFGDRFHPLGAPGVRKVKKYFIDVKVPKGERDRIPLLIFGGRIAWIGGERIDHRVRITEHTRKALLMKID